MYKHYACITGFALFFFVQSAFVVAAEKQEQKPADGSNRRTDGLQIMTAVSKRDRGKDYVMSTKRNGPQIVTSWPF